MTGATLFWQNIGMLTYVHTFYVSERTIVALDAQYRLASDEYGTIRMHCTSERCL
jgi:hypothetical protein